MAAKLARSQRAPTRGPTEGRSLLKVGDLLAAKYRVERILGEGGMGVVVAAYHELLDQRVAVKLLYQDVADREAQSRLLLEARSAAKLHSEHVARVLDVDTGENGLPFIVMELLEGADLCEIADARGALPRWLVVDYMLQALEGLAHAHARGIIHRDLKPSNLFLANRADGAQILKILDFGISKSLAPAEPGEGRRAMQLTGGRSVLGSPPYMSPEQVRAPKTVDHRTDIWSLGICMYELLTNSMPFGGDEIQETFAQILERQPAPIRQLVTGVPEGLEQVVMTCLAKNRDERFADVGELARALAPYGSGAFIQAPERVAATLARGAEESASGTRLRGATTAGGRMAIPAAPGRRLDSMQPELTGTASTVARGFTVFESKKRLMLALMVVPAAIGLVLIAVAFLHRAPAPAQAGASAPPAEVVDPAAVARPVGPATGIITAPVHTAGPANELAPTGPVRDGVALPAPTLIGASPEPPAPEELLDEPEPEASAAASSAPAPKATVKRKARRTPKRRAQPKRRATSKPSLPPGLPRERQ